MNICNTIFEPLISGLFGVIGGSIPITIIVSIFFYKTRQNFRNALPSEEKMLKKLCEILDQEKKNLTLLAEAEARVKTATEELKQEFLAYKTHTQQKIFDYELQIIIQESWINKVKNSGLWEWIIYSISSRYFKDYFKK